MARAKRSAELIDARISSNPPQHPRLDLLFAHIFRARIPERMGQAGRDARICHLFPRKSLRSKFPAHGERTGKLGSD